MTSSDGIFFSFSFFHWFNNTSVLTLICLGNHHTINIKHFANFLANPLSSFLSRAAKACMMSPLISATIFIIYGSLLLSCLIFFKRYHLHHLARLLTLIVNGFPPHLYLMFSLHLTLALYTKTPIASPALGATLIPLADCFYKEN